jgi:16S rRNA (adenine(1408)-N(1))-methyltransferase
LHEARRDPGRIVIGVDADASSMREAARRASRSGLANAAFVAAAAEALPDDLTGVADRVTISFPWGSLLRAVVTADADTMRRIASVTRPGACLTAVWSLTPRDGAVAAAVDQCELVRGFELVGLEVVGLRTASPDEVAATHSSWAKRLGVGRNRSATILRAVKR